MAEVTFYKKYNRCSQLLIIHHLWAVGQQLLLSFYKAYFGHVIVEKMERDDDGDDDDDATMIMMILMTNQREIPSYP